MNSASCLLPLSSRPDRHCSSQVHFIYYNTINNWYAWRELAEESLKISMEKLEYSSQELECFAFSASYRECPEVSQ